MIEGIGKRAALPENRTAARETVSIAGRSGSGVLGDLNRNRLKEVRLDIISLAKVFDRIVVDLGSSV